MTTARFATIPDAIAAIARGEPVVVVDDEGRENEGDPIVAAEAVTPETVAFLVRHTSGVICVALPGEHLRRLHIPLMVADNADSMGTAFTGTVDYRHGTSTGISAADRAATIRAPAPAPTTSRAPATSSRCARATAESCAAPASTAS